MSWPLMNRREKRAIEAITAKVEPRTEWTKRALLKLMEQMVDAIVRVATLYLGVAACKGIKPDSAIAIQAMRWLDPDGTDEPYGKDDEGLWRDVANEAAAAIRTDFASINADAAVSLWAKAEDGVRTFVVDWIIHDRATRTREGVVSLLGKAGAPARDEEDIAHRIDQAPGVRSEAGTRRLDGMLKLIGFVAPVTPAVRRDLFELAQVRHAIAHRRGTADQKLLNACPSLASRFPKGHEIRLRFADVNRYAEACMAYATSAFENSGDRMKEAIRLEAIKRSHSGRKRR
jgi:hypothetical protein